MLCAVRQSIYGPQRASVSKPNAHIGVARQALGAFAKQHGEQLMRKILIPLYLTSYFKFSYLLFEKKT